MKKYTTLAVEPGLRDEINAMAGGVPVGAFLTTLLRGLSEEGNARLLAVREDSRQHLSLGEVRVLVADEIGRLQQDMNDLTAWQMACGDELDKLSPGIYERIIIGSLEYSAKFRSDGKDVTNK